MKKFGIKGTILLIVAAILTFGSAGAVIFSPGDCPSGMVSYWTFDDSNPYRVTDFYDGNHGIPNGDATYIPGLIGKAMGGFSAEGGEYPRTWLSGGDYGSYPKPQDGPLSVAIWVYPTASSPSLQAIVSTRYYDQVIPFEIVFGGTASNFGWIIQGENINWNWAWSSSVILNRWYLVVGIFDGNNYTIYVNGVQEDSNSLNGNMPYWRNQLWIGARPDCPNCDHFVGVLDDFAMFNRALTATEIQQMYNNGLVALSSGDLTKALHFI